MQICHDRFLPNLQIFIHFSSIGRVLMTCFGIYFEVLAGDEGLAVRMCQDFPHPSKMGLEPTLPPTQRVPRLFPGSKAAVAGR